MYICVCIQCRVYCIWSIIITFHPSGKPYTLVLFIYSKKRKQFFLTAWFACIFSLSNLQKKIITSLLGWKYATERYCLIFFFSFLVNIVIGFYFSHDIFCYRLSNIYSNFIVFSSLGDAKNFNPNIQKWWKYQIFR